MYIIAGIGNPGSKYENTRHNVGFEVIDILADRMGVCVDEKKHRALCGRGILEGEKVILAKPQTFTNLSGESVRSGADYYKVSPENMIVVFDDISLEPGQLRIRGKGSAGDTMGSRILSPIWGPRNFPV